MRTVCSAPQTQVVSLVVSNFSFLLLYFPFLLKGFAGLLAGRLLRGSVGHGELHSLWAADSIGDGLEGGEKLVQRNGRHADGRIADSIRQHQGALMEEGTAGVDDIWHIAVLLIGSWGEKRFTKLADDPGGILEFEQDGSDAVGAHGSDAVSQHQPACIGLNR